MGTFDDPKGLSVRKSSRKVSASRTASARKSAIKRQKNPALSRRLLQHPVSNLDKGKAQESSHTGTEELICDSDDSLFGDSGLSDSILGSLPVLNTIQKDSTQSETHDRTKTDVTISKTNLDSRLHLDPEKCEVKTSQHLLPEKEDIFISRKLSQSQTQDGKPKRRSIEFRAVSGSQLSFEEESTESGNHKMQPSPSSTNLHQQSLDKIKEQSDKQKVGEPNSKDVYKISISEKPQVETNRMLHASPAVRGYAAAGVTPVSARSRLLRDRQKRLSVGGSSSVPSPASRAAQLRAENLEQALREAEEVRAAGTVYDIGPFYGLPSKVPELFQKHRGIKSLYGMGELTIIFFYERIISYKVTCTVMNNSP